MNRINSNLKIICALAVLALLFGQTAHAQRQMEKLGRGVVALHSATSQAYIGWRLLATDPSDIGFNIYRSANGAAGVKLNGAVLTNTTDYLDTGANFTISNAWYVRPVISGVEQAPSATYGLAANSPVRQYLSIPLVNPGAFAPYDVKFAWFGDFDGDGEYDYLVDRMSADTGGVNQFLQAYKRDGTFLWQMDMGFNSTNTANAYEPDAAAISVGDKDNVTVYDLDGDGKAEVIVRTANGTIFANGAQVVTNNNVTQFLSILDGLTGVEKARAVIPNLYYADGPLNCHMGIIYWDGIHPSILLDGENRVGSGNFQRQTVTWDYRNGQLTQRWVRGDVPGENQSEGHQLRIADVNHDGKDDLVQIASVVTDNVTSGVLLYDTELVHGDRYHVTDIDPERSGLEMYSIQQNNGTLLATALQDMGTGELFKKWYSGGVTDVGRGVTLDMTATTRGYEMYSTQPGIFDRKGAQIYANNLWAPEAIWWDADVLREFEDGAGSGALSPVINKFNPATGNADRIYTLYNEDGGCHQAYGGRAALWGDLFGDWREEFMVVANDYNSVRIYTTKIQATNRIYCLMQNPMYRVQSTYKGYYQASYVDYYLGNDMPAVPIPPVSDAAFVWRGGASSTWDNATANWFTNNLWVSNFAAVTLPSATSVLFDLTGSNSAPIAITGALTPSDVRVHSPKDYTFDSTAGSLSGTMKLTKAGAGKLTLNGTNTYTGATLVGEGALIVNGSLPSSPVTVRGGVWLDGRLGGTGVVGSTVRIEEGAGFAPGAETNSPGTLTIANNVTLAGRTLHDFDLSDNPGGVNDLVVITGNLTLQGTNTLVIRKLNLTLPPGVYPLINYSGALSGSLNNLAVSGLPGVPLALTNPPGQIALVVKNYRAPTTINWTGGSGGNVWDLFNTTNFLNGAVKDKFAPGDTVRFDSIGTSNLTANLSGDLNATTVIVDSTANYTLAGNGGIIAASSLTKSNTGTLTISALNNSYTGKTTIAGGTVVVSELDAVGYPSPLGNPPAGSTNLILSGSSTLRVTGESYTDRGLTLNTGQNTLEVFNAADQVTIAGQIVGSGTLRKSGDGTLALNVANTYSGGTIISAGSISLGSVAGNQTGVGSGSVTFSNGTLSMINIQASETAAWPMIVPTNNTGRLNVDGRCTLTGSLTGSGAFTVWTPYVRTDFSGNWSAFTGQINVITDNDGGDFRCNNSSGYPNARMNLAALTSLQCRVGGTPTISIGELSAVQGSAVSAPGGNSGLPATWSVGGLNTSAMFAANTYNGINFIKVGTGTWTWTGTNIAHTGTLTVNGGTLLLNANAAAAPGNVTVGSSGTLGGTGTVGGNTTVNGKLAPGNNAIGTLNFNNNLTFGASGTAVIEINRTASTKDLAAAAGTLTYAGTLQVTNLSGTLALDDSFKIFDAAVYAGMFTAFSLPALNPGLAWSTASLITNGTITVVNSGVLPPAPDAPTNLVATAASFSQINLTWADASTNETSFLIERSTNGVNFSQITSVGAGATTSASTGLEDNTTYYYRVRASNTGGNSPYSNIASATTPAAPAPLVWRGDGAGNTWDLNTTANWRSNGVTSVFTDGQAAIFDDSGSNNTSINLAGLISPSAVTVTATKSYTFAGAGLLGGSGVLTKSGSGTLSIGSSNAHSGGTFIGGGTVALTSETAGIYGLGSGSVTISNATLTMFDNFSTFTGVGWNLIVPEDAVATLNADSRCDFYGSLTGGGTLNLRIPSNRTTLWGNWSAFTGVLNALPSGSGGKDFRIGPDYSWPGLPNATLHLGTNINMYWTGNQNSGATGSFCDIGALTGTTSAHLMGGTIGGRLLTYRVGYLNTDAAFSGNISDQVAGSPTLLTKVGSGNWVLSGSNTYSGITTISGGTLQFGDGGNTGTLPTNNIVNNATLAFNRANNITDSGFISGTGVVIQDGDGTVTFTKNHTYSGQTLINSGTLALTGSGSFANSSLINIASGAVLDVSGRTGGNLTLTSGKVLTGFGNVTGNFIVASGAFIAPGNSLGTLTFNDNLTLNSGSTTTMEISTPPASSDRLQVLGTLACGGTLVVTNSGGHPLGNGDTFELFNAALITGSFPTITLPTLSAGLVWKTNLLYATGTISVGLPDPKAVTWKGDGAANAWDLSASNWLNTNNAAVAFADLDAVTINDAGSNNVPISLNTAVQPGSLTINATKSYTLTGSGGIGGTNSLTKSGPGGFTLATTNNYTGDTVISAGPLIVANPGAGLKNRWSFNGSLTDSVSGQNATVVEVGANNTTLSATEITLAGGAQASSDYVDLGDQILPNDTTPVTIEVWAKPLSVQNWSRIFDFGAGTGENLMMSWTRGTTLAQDRVEWVDTASLSTSNDTCQPYTLGVEFHIAMVIQPGAGAGGTTRVIWYRAAATNSTLGAARGSFDTANTLAILNDTNCWLGRSQWPDNTANASYNEVRIWNRALSAGDLQALHASGPDAIFGAGLPSVSAVHLSGATGKLDLQNGAQSIASLSGVAGSEVKLTAANLTVGGDDSSTTFAGFFSGPNGFTKTGTGTLTLTGNSTHTGATTASAGTLLVHGNHSAATGAVTVASGATLGGNGTLGGATAIQPGGTLAPGVSIGAITFTNSLTLAGTTVMEISHMPLTNDVVNKTGPITYGGTLAVSSISGPLAAGDSFKLFNAPSYAGSFSSITLPSLDSGLVWTTNTLNTTGTIYVSSAVSTTPTNITFTAAGNNLTLSWPASHTGWTLQTQTNSLTTGLSGAWFNVAGSTTTNSMIVPINPANPTVFYRLTLP